MHCNPRGLAEAEKAARRNSATDTAKTVHQARVSTGSLRPGELPIKNYDTLTIGDAVAQVQTLTYPADVRAIIGYEANHKTATASSPQPRPTSRASPRTLPPSAEHHRQQHRLSPVRSQRSQGRTDCGVSKKAPHRMRASVAHCRPCGCRTRATQVFGHHTV